MDGNTPGMPIAKEDQDSFNHKYYVRTMKIIDLKIQGKDKLVSSENLLTEINLRNVFY